MNRTPTQRGRTLRRLREARGLSRPALATQARLSVVYVRKLEAGRSDMTIGVLQRLAKALGVKPARFLD